MLSPLLRIKKVSPGSSAVLFQLQFDIIRIMRYFLFILLLIPFSPCSISTAFSEMTAYNIDVRYESETQQITGSEEIIFTNKGANPLSALYIALYPNLYLSPYPHRDLDFNRRVYPVAFNSGGLIIRRIEDKDGKALPFFPDPLRGKTLFVVVLPSAIPAGGTYRFFVHFETNIPEKRGVFGYYKDLVTLQGGWHPYLSHFSEGRWDFNSAPQPSRFRVHLSLDETQQALGSSPQVLIDGQATEQKLLMEGDKLPFFSLSIGKHFAKSKQRIGEITLNTYSLPKDRAYTRRIIEVIEAAALHFLKQSGPLPPTNITLTEAYLHQNLTAIGTNMLYLSNRFFKVFPTLKRYHEASLARGLYQLLWRQKRPKEASWVLEALAARDAEHFIQERHGKTFSLANWLKPLGFIPLIDQVLYSKDLPLRQVYFYENIPPLVSEDIRFYNHPSSEAPNIFYKLEILMGKTAFEQIVRRYRDQKDGNTLLFRQMLSELSNSGGGREINSLIDQWLGTRSEIDFSIKQIDEVKIEGRYQTSIHINKQGKGNDPLQIVAQEKNGTLIPIVWDGRSHEHTVVLETTEGIQSVTLDPDLMSNDPNRKNNTLPHKWKVLVDEFQASYDFQTDDLSLRSSLLFQFLYDTNNWVKLLYSQTTAGEISHIAYTRTIKKNHSFTTALTFETREPSLSNRFKEEAGLVSLGYHFIFPDLPLLTEFAKRLTTTFPAFDVGLDYSQQFTDSVFDNSLTMTIDFRRTLSFTNYHEIGTRILIGQSLGKLFENRRFALGGTDTLRGYTPLTFEGENMSLFSFEYRFPLIYESDINLLGLAHTHTWQGALFTSTGMVSGSHNVFKLNRFRSDVGTGIRFFVDLFGVFPSIIRVDLAIPIDSPIKDEEKVHYYLNAGQSF